VATHLAQALEEAQADLRRSVIEQGSDRSRVDQVLSLPARRRPAVEQKRAPSAILVPGRPRQPLKEALLILWGEEGVCAVELVANAISHLRSSRRMESTQLQPMQQEFDK
jgi:hypothetical protein